jgi:hypothetical protein
MEGYFPIYHIDELAVQGVSIAEDEDVGGCASRLCREAPRASLQAEQRCNCRGEVKVAMG